MHSVDAARSMEKNASVHLTTIGRGDGLPTSVEKISSIAVVLIYATSAAALVPRV